MRREKMWRMLCVAEGIVLAVLAMIFIPKYIKSVSARLYKRRNGHRPEDLVDRDPVIVRRSDEKPVAGREKLRLEQELEQELELELELEQDLKQEPEYEMKQKQNVPWTGGEGVS